MMHWSLYVKSSLLNHHATQMEPKNIANTIIPSQATDHTYDRGESAQLKSMLEVTS